MCSFLIIGTACSVSGDGLKRRAEQGDARAQYELGKRYSERKSYPRARVWLHKAARQGHAGAQNRLGVMYERGEGVRRDRVDAYMWFTLAAAAGNSFASANRASLECRLNVEQIVAAKARLQSFAVIHVTSK